MKPSVAIAIGAFLVFGASSARADDFTYDEPGKLPTGSGKGRPDTNVYAPDMRFPIETGPAFANSQVWGRGGLNGGGGSQCDKENFSYPWHDNYCETRSWDMPLCPSGTGHQGQDIRAASCEKGVHWVVAAREGTVTNVGSYSVYITAPDGTRFDYLHMSDVAVKEGDKVARGQHIGKVSNQFGGEVTTVHLHFNIRQNVAGVGSVYVPPYLSLVKAYQTLLNPKEEPPPPPPEKPAPKEEKAAPLPVPEEPPPPPLAEDEGCTTSRPAPSGPASALLVFAAIAVVLRRRRA
jgi:murein DD-endopeptidase MepM/ murein hydrolase activator NlpD